MDAQVTFYAAFLVGIFATVHCVGMCGSIMGALSLSLSEPIRANRINRFFYVSSYNIGRVLSYTIAGFIAGSLGMGIIEITNIPSGFQVLRYSSVVVMIIIGLYLAGWFPQISAIEKIGLPVWKILEPIGRKLMPVDSIFKVFFYGMIWGWLPCGMVYTVLVWTLTAGSAINGALTMLAFGLGTMPAMIAAGVTTTWLTRFAQSAATRRFIGLLIILMAIASLFVVFDGGHQHHHHH